MEEKFLRLVFWTLIVLIVLHSSLVAAPNSNDIFFLDEEINSLHKKIWLRRKHSRLGREWNILNEQSDSTVRPYLDQCPSIARSTEQLLGDGVNQPAEVDWPTNALEYLEHEFKNLQQQLSKLQQEYGEVNQDSKAFTAYGHSDSSRRNYWRERLRSLQSYMDCVESRIAQNRRRFDNIRAEALALECELPRPPQLSS